MIAVAVLSELARRGETAADAAARAIEKYDLHTVHQEPEKDTTEGGSE